MRLFGLASDERLVEQVRAGSEPAFEAIFDRYHRGLLGFCRHMLGSADEAEDAVQQTFLAAYRAMVGSDRELRLRPWLYTIARNRCVSILRARREQPAGDLVEPETENLSAAVHRREDLRELLRDLARLPDDQRAALVLAELDALSHEEIADVLGCPRERVKALVFRARSTLTASRLARETPCTEIREQLAVLRGGSLRRNTLRRHLRDCPGCRAYRAELGEQRRALALILPVTPTLGLKGAVMGASSAAGAGTAAGGGAAATGGVAATGGGASAITAKALVTIAIAGGGAAATVDAVRDDAPRPAPRAAEKSSGPVGSGRGPAPGTNLAAATVAVGAAEGEPGVRRRARGIPKGSPRGLARGRRKHGPPRGRGAGSSARGDARKAEKIEAREQRAASKQARKEQRRAAGPPGRQGKEPAQAKVPKAAKPATPTKPPKRAKPPKPAKPPSPAPAAAVPAEPTPEPARGNDNGNGKSNGKSNGNGG